MTEHRARAEKAKSKRDETLKIVMESDGVQFYIRALGEAFATAYQVAITEAVEAERERTEKKLEHFPFTYTTLNTYGSQEKVIVDLGADIAQAIKGEKDE